MTAQIVLVLAVALALRFCLVVAYPPAATPEIAFYRGDAPAYHRYASSIAIGLPYDQGLPFHPPLLAWLVAPIYKLLGGTNGGGMFLVVRTLMAAIGALVAVLTLLIGRRAGGRQIGLWAGALVALHFGLAASSTTLNAGALDAALELGAVLLVWHGSRQRGATRAAVSWVAAGVLAGLAALARAEDLAFVVVLAAAAAWMSMSRARTAAPHDSRADVAEPREAPGHPAPAATGRSLRPWRLAGARALFVLGAGLLTILPWSIRNATVIGTFNRTRAAAIAEPLSRFAPVTMYGGLNFALANHAAATGGFSRQPLPSPGGGSQLDLALPEHLRFVNHGFELGLGYIAAHPGPWLRLVGRKLAIAGDALGLGYGARDLGGGLRGLRRAVDFMGPARSALVIPHLLAALIGIVVITRRLGRANAFLLHVPVVVKLLAVVAFFGYVRVALVALPILLIDVTVGVAAVAAVAIRLGRARLAGTASGAAPAAASGARSTGASGARPTAASGARPALAVVSIAAAALIMGAALLDGAWLAHTGQEICYRGQNELGGNRVNLDGDLELWPARAPGDCGP